MATWTIDRFIQHYPSMVSLDIAVATGVFPNASLVTKIGRNLTITASTAEWVTAGGIWYVPAAAVKVEVASSDNADSTQSVVLTGLTTANVVATETLDLTGRTPVESANTYIAMNSARLVVTATPTISATAAGTVYVADTAITWSAGVPAAGGDLAKVFNTIPIGYWHDTDAVYTVPTGFDAIVAEASVSASRGLVEIVKKTAAGVYSVIFGGTGSAHDRAPRHLLLDEGDTIAYRVNNTSGSDGDAECPMAIALFPE